MCDGCEQRWEICIFSFLLFQAEFVFTNIITVALATILLQSRMNSWCYPVWKFWNRRIGLFRLFIWRACNKFLPDSFWFLLIVYISRKAPKNIQFVSGFQFSRVYQRFIWTRTYNGILVQRFLENVHQASP